jgi:hypothetical protein
MIGTVEVAGFFASTGKTTARQSAAVAIEPGFSKVSLVLSCTQILLIARSIGQLSSVPESF